jgi:hypothetical protein
MNVPRKSRLPAASAWQLEFVRLIAFPTNAPFVIEQHWLRDLVSRYGEQPEDFVSTAKKQSREDRGTFQGALLSLTVDPGHVIWEARSPDVVDVSGRFPTLGPFREKIDWFVALLSPWLSASCPPLVRLAFSAKMLQHADSPKEAYRVLAAHLPALKVDSSLNDFLLQINRRKESSTIVKGLPINRVSTWSKMNIALFVEPGRPFNWPEECYSALELDINTAPEKADILPRELLPQLFGELASLGMDIAERRDPP